MIKDWWYIRKCLKEGKGDFVYTFHKKGRFAERYQTEDLYVGMYHPDGPHGISCVVDYNIKKWGIFGSIWEIYAPIDFVEYQFEKVYGGWQKYRRKDVYGETYYIFRVRKGDE